MEHHFTSSKEKDLAEEAKRHFLDASNISST